MKILKCALLAAAACSLGGVALAANPVKSWPSFNGDANAQICETVEAQFMDLQRQLDDRHSACLGQVGSNQTEVARGSCSRTQCQDLHTALFTEYEMHHTQTMNACRVSIRQTQQQCLGRIANQQNDILRQKSADEDGYRQHCNFGKPLGDMAMACDRLQARMKAADQQMSGLIDRKSDCQ